MTIPCNKNITKQLNNYSYVIAITLHDLLQRIKRALIVIPLLHVITMKYKIPKIPYQNICFYLYLTSFSLLLIIFLIRFSLFLTRFSLSLSTFSLRPLRSSSSSWLWKHSLSHLSLYGCGGPLSVRLASVFNLYSIDFFFPRFSICTVLVFSLFFFFFSYITIVVNLYSTGFCVYWFFSQYSIGYFFLSYITIVVNLYSTGFCVYLFFS